MPNYWEYNGIKVSMQINSAQDGEIWEVPLIESEGWTNVKMRTILSLHLRHWGYKRNDIYSEQTPSGISIGRRPDLFAVGKENFPSFWFECNRISSERLSDIETQVNGVRVVHVVMADFFERAWNHVDWYEEYMTEKNPDENELVEHRRDLIPDKTEIWALSEDIPAGYIAFAVRRDNDQFTYLDSGEGNRVIEFRGFKKTNPKVAPLIEGFIGDKNWNGKSRRT